MFVSRHVKHSKLLFRHAQKYLHYKADVITPADRDQVESGMRRLKAALRQRDRKEIQERAEALDGHLHRLTPVNWESHWRENVEVILVAIVVAVGIRSYFLQPFKIPTGSMQPTLNGIIGYPYEANRPIPNIFQQAFEFTVRGRNYINVVSREDDRILQVEPKKFLFFFTFTRLICNHQSFLVYAPPEILKSTFNIFSGKTFGRGEIIAKGAIDTGDQVFVDKFSYNFVKPHRGDVFVFRTNHIPQIPEDPQTGAPFYIKRLGGTPRDVLRIAQPLLYVKGPNEEIEHLADEYGFKRVMSTKDGYRGYSNSGPPAMYLTRPDQTFAIPQDGYFALGDNSFNSFDSRYWGPVPEENLVGRGLFVYWPFQPHWGLIR
ncbi:MAG TPA: signal peptidase I [Chthoniobacterales bacterium]|jgi:signal peptidase I